MRAKPAKWSEMIKDNAKRVCHTCNMLFSNKTMMIKHFKAKNFCVLPQGTPRDIIDEKKRKVEKMVNSRTYANRMKEIEKEVERELRELQEPERQPQ